MKPYFPQAATRLLSSLPSDLEDFAVVLCTRLVSEFGATLYVKTIYVGVEIDGSMIAAVYPFADRFDIALALEEDHQSSLLEDATHLTWPSLPVLVSVRSETSRAEVESLASEAAGRVAKAEHHVSRSPEFFRGRTQRLSHKPGSESEGRA
jgi:hypothetical protein